MQELLIGLYYRPWVLFIWGAIWGSFLNVVLYRFPLGLSVVLPGSACPSCRHEIAAYDNIPILSWLILRGKCRHCAAKISPRYLLNEALFGLLNLGPVLFFSRWQKGVGLALMLTWSLPALILLLRIRRAPWYLAPGFLLGLALFLWP